MSPQYGELRPTSGWDPFVSLGTAGNFNGFRVLTALLHGTVVVGVSQTLRRWTEGATYIRQGGHHVGHWPAFLVSVLKSFLTSRSFSIFILTTFMVNTLHFDSNILVTVDVSAISLTFTAALWICPIYSDILGYWDTVVAHSGTR